MTPPWLWWHTYNDSFYQKLESVQYNATLAITEPIRDTSLEKLYQELGLEPLQQRHWYCKICTFSNIIKEKSPDYLFNIIPKNNSNHRTRNSCNIPKFNIKHNSFKNSFFPSVIAEWNKPNSDIWNLNKFILSLFKTRISKFIRPNLNSIFNCHNSTAIKYLSRIRLSLGHLDEHKFKHSFQDALNLICACGSDIEAPCHYLISYPIFDAEQNTLLNNIRQITPSILNLNHSQITHVLLYGDSSLKNETNTEILNSTMNYILSTKRLKVLSYKRWYGPPWNTPILFCLFKINKVLFIIFCYSQMLT